MKRIILGVILMLLYLINVQAQCPPAGGGVFVNEVYNDNGSATEYVELVVVGDPGSPLDPVDLSGWIIDDNNIDMAGQGTASGHLVFDNSFNNVLPGAIILIYNESFPYGGLPASNPPYLYVVTGASLDGCSASPSTANATYAPCGTAGGNWMTVGMRNAGDIIQVREASSFFYHGLQWGGVTVSDAPLDVGVKTIGLDCGDWFDASNYTIIVETPGAFNSVDNETLILGLRAGTVDCNDLTDACDMLLCPEINDISLPTVSVCENESFIVTASDLANMDQTINGETDFDISFVYFNGSTAPTDPYTGGIGLGIVLNADFTGVDPNENATLSVPANTMAPGMYNICAILSPESTNPDCEPYQCIEMEILAAPTVDLTGNHDFCPGDCYKLEIMINGGVEPYDIDFRFTLTGLPPIDFTMDSYDVDNQVNICYDGTGFFPVYEASGNIWHLPTSITGSGTLEILEVRTGNNCKATIINNALSINLFPSVDIDEPDPYHICDDDTDGITLFDLTTLNNEINGGNGNDVEYYTDMDLLNLIDPDNAYFSDNSIVFAVVRSSDGCLSEVVEVELVVDPIGDVGDVNLYCGDIGELICTYCTSGEQEVDIIFDIADNSTTYDIVIQFGSGSQGFFEFQASNVSNGDVFPFTISEDTEFLLISVTALGECPDETNLGLPVIVELIDGPILEVVTPQIACDTVFLADILGVNLTGNESYYTEPGGMGTALSPGSFITTNTTLYAYDAEGDCFDEVEVEIQITDIISIDPVVDVVQCNYYVLPEISGTNLTGNEAYYFGSNGTNPSYQPGDTIKFTVDLYLFDPTVDCLEEEQVFNIMITAGPSVTNSGDTIVCNNYILETIEGTGLNGSEIYNTALNGEGDILMVGDTIFEDTKVYIYAASGDDCIVQDSFLVSFSAPSNIGMDTTITICFGELIPVNIWMALGDGVDTAGIWSGYVGAGVSLADSTSLDFSGVSPGVYNYAYTLLDTTCGMFSTEVVIDVKTAPNAGVGNDTIICSSEIIDLDDILGTHDNGGVWSQDPANTLDLSNINQVSLDGISQDNIVLKYLLDIGGSCEPDSSIINLTIVKARNAGKDSIHVECIGGTIDLKDLIKDSDGFQVFTDKSATGQLTGSIFNTVGLSAGTYTFTHRITAAPPCTDNDEATIDIELVDNLSAGNPENTNVCVGESIDLTSLLTGDQGGVFSDYSGSGFLSGNMVTILNDNATSIDFSYIIGGGTCPEDSTIVTINIDAIPELNWSLSDNQICKDDCSIINVNTVGVAPYNYNVEVIYDEIPLINYPYQGNQSSIELSVCYGEIISFGNDTIFLSESGTGMVEFFVINYNDANCDGNTTGLDTLGIELLENNLVVIDTTVCEQVTIQGVLFDKEHLTEIIEVDDPTACKTIYDITVHIGQPELDFQVVNPECPDGQGTLYINSLNGNPEDFTLVVDDVYLPIDQIPYDLFLSIGDHTIAIEDDMGCSTIEENVSVVAGQAFDFTMLPLDSISINEFQFTGMTTYPDNYTVIWTPSDSLSCAACLDPIIKRGQEDMIYELMIMYSLNCSYTVNVFVPALAKIEPEPEDINVIYVPNIFNPEFSDFYVTTKEACDIDEFLIYDRWGNLMFESTSLDGQSSEGWNGRYKNEKVDPGVYVYAIKLKLNGDKETIKTGALTLIR